MHKHSKTLFTLLLVGCTTLNVNAESNHQRVESQVEYKLTASDTESSGRLRAINKANKQLQLDAQKKFSLTIHMTGAGGMDTDDNSSIPQVVSTNILAEELKTCERVKLSDSKCYYVTIEGMVDVGFTVPTSAEISEAEDTLKMTNELLN